MNKKKYTCEQVPLIAQALIQLPVRIWTFHGSLGAGKTSLVQAMLYEWGVRESVQSPTYSYVVAYQLPDCIIYHFDLYRLTTAEQFIQAGFDEYLYDSSARILIEWADKIEHFLPHPFCHVSIEYEALEEREVSWQLL